MKANEIKLEEQSFTMSANTCPSRSHYKFIMKLGRVLPSTPAQARHFIKLGRQFDVLNLIDVSIIEALLNKHGYSGDYTYTKSKRWVRLESVIDLHKALKKEYSL